MSEGAPLTPVQLIAKEVDALRDEVEIAIARFERRTGISVYRIDVEHEEGGEPLAEVVWELP